MSDALVPYQRTDFGVYKVRAGHAVRSNTWQTLAALHNWVKGRGCSVIPFYSPYYDAGTGSPWTFKFQVPLHPQVIRLMWVVLIEGNGENGSVTVRAPAGGGGASQTFSVSPGPGTNSPVILLSAVPSQTSAAQEIDVDITTSANIIVVGLGCFGLPRNVLQNDATERGEPLASFSYGQPIIKPEYMGTDLADINTGGRKASLHQWATPASLSASHAHRFTSGSYTNLFDFGVPILGRKVAGTTIAAQNKMYAAVDSGTGTLRLTTSAGAVTRTVTATSLAWTTRNTITIHAEDMDSVDGRQTAATPAWDTLHIAGKIEGGGTILYLASSSTYTDP